MSVSLGHPDAEMAQEVPYGYEVDTGLPIRRVAKVCQEIVEAQVRDLQPVCRHL